MSTYEITGSNTTLSGRFGDEVVLIMTMPDSVQPSISYNTSFAPFGSIPTAQVSLPRLTEATIDGIDVFSSSQVQTYIIEATWGFGVRTQLMYFHYTNAFTGEFQEWTFELGGARLPRNSEGIDIPEWTTTLTAANVITSGTFREGANINIRSFLDTEQVDGLNLTGDAFVNVLTGRYDDDELNGLGGNDTLRGNEGDDTLRGGKQSDLLEGGDGNDQLFGQRDADLLNGGSGNDKLNAGGGNDTLNGGNGEDFLKGGTRNDLLNGGAGNDRLFGNSGKDTLNGGNGNDKLNAGGDDDRLNGGEGNDTLKGGAGADSFVFKDNSGDDVISDFNLSEGDVIDLRGVAYLAGSSKADAYDMVLLEAAGQGDDLLLNIAPGATVLLENVSRDDLTEDAFLF